MNIKEKLKLSNELINQKKFNESKVILQNVLESSPNNLWAINSLLKVTVLLNEYQFIAPLILKRTSFKNSHPSDSEFTNLISNIIEKLRHEIYSKPEYKFIMALVKQSFNEWDTLIRKESTNINRKFKVAVLITGQIRGYETSLPSIKKFLEDVDHDIFFAVWDKLGFRDITQDKRSYKHLNRTFDSDFCNLVNSKDIDLTGYLDAARNLKKHLTPKFEKKIIDNYFSDYKLTLLNECDFEKQYSELERKLTAFHPDSEVVFANSLNMLKMSYSNHIGLCMAKNSNNNYTHILKIRPDFIVNDKYSLKEIISSQTLSNFSFIDSWGGNIGDQFYFGPWKDGCFYNSLWDLWVKMKEPIMDIGNLMKPHKRLYDYLQYGKINYIYLPNISRGLDSSSKIPHHEHINLIKSDFEYFKNNATHDQLHLFNEYLREFSS